MEDLTKTLTTYGKIGVDVLRQAVAPYDVTGKTQASIKFAVDENKLTFIAREYFQLLEKGRRPTTKKPSKEMIENLTEYAIARGFDNPERAAWAIATKLNRDGDKTHQRGGRVVYSDVMETFMKELKKEISEVYKKDVVDKFKRSFNGA